MSDYILRRPVRSWVGTVKYGIAIASACALPALSASAADLQAEAAIGKVTVYQRGATIARTGTVAIPAGNHRLVFKDIPANVDASLIRVIVNSKAVRLGSVDTERVTQADYFAAQERQLRKDIEKLEDDKAALDDEIHTAEAQLRVLDSVSFGQSSQATKSSLDVPSLQGAIGTIATTGASARTRIRESGLRKREIDRTVAKLNQDLKKVATARKDSLVVRATIEATAAVTAPVFISYNIDDAQWQWIYEAHLDSTTKKVALVKQAQVRQGSGEDWGNVELTLTASKPSHENRLAALHSLYLKAEEPGTYHGRTTSVAAAAPALEEVVVTGQALKQTFRRREVEKDKEDEPGTYIEMDTNATEFATEYLVPGKISLAANREPRMFPVSEEEFAVDLVARTVPKRERQAYLEATFKYERNVPLQAGELQLFRDDAFIGKAVSDTLLPGADVRLPFGVDERIRVAVKQEQEQSGKRGVFGRQKLKDERLRFEVSNYHTYPIRVEVLDRLPISKSSDVRVDLPAGGTPATQKDYDNKPGLMLWVLNVEPRQTAAVKHYVEIRYPSDKQLAGFEAQE